ncbi:MAG: phosphatidate cytidylyltransferase [Clostridia bacterium]|nr:phosphatidate cytidylyltransferase [Clostridia bacterium]
MKKSMLTRTVVGVALALIFLTLWFLGGFTSFSRELYTGIFTLINLLCTFEIMRLLRLAGYKITAYPLYIAAAGIPVSLAYFKTSFVFYAIAFITVLMTVLARLFNKDARNEDLIMNLFPFFYPLAPLACLFRACTLGSLELSRVSMFITFAGPLIGDTLAYFTGVLFGKRKLCEHISPHKTIAGSVGGVIGGGLAGVCTYYIQHLVNEIYVVDAQNPEVHIPFLLLLGTGLVLGILGQVGDLFASSIKRWAGVKDYGSLFPGHGGMLDRIDSVLMCAPLVVLIFSNFT